jgi:hypothetical protein
MFRSGYSNLHNLNRIIANIDVCIESELPKFKVPIGFLGTARFSPPREGRYIILNLLK